MDGHLRRTNCRQLVTREPVIVRTEGNLRSVSDPRQRPALRPSSARQRIEPFILESCFMRARDPAQSARRAVWRGRPDPRHRDDR